MHRTISLIAALGLTGALACGGGAPAASPTGTAVNTCAKAHQSTHVAYVVVQHLSGQTIERCAGFGGDTIDAAAVMRATGIQLRAGSSAMCQVDHEPQQFNDCSSDQPHWWLWLYTIGGWTVPTVPYVRLRLHDREALGWRYVVPPAPSPSPPPVPRPL